MAKKVLISVGGTGGHIFPAQSLADELRECGIDFIFVGGGLEKNPYFNSSKFNFLEIETSPLTFRSLHRLPFQGYKIIKGILQSLKILRKFQPDLIIGFGSFHSFPLLVASRILRRSYYLHEQNIQVGQVNKLFAKKATRFVSPYLFTKPFYEEIQIRAKMPLKFQKEHILPKEKIREELGLDLNKTTVLIFGGSQGAQFINELALQSLTELKKHELQVIHLIGNNSNLQSIMKAYEEGGVKALVKEFEPNIDVLLSAADFCISRAGASTIAEQIELEIPAILIPYPHASNHQEQNADYMQNEVEGGIKLMEKDITASLLSKVLVNFVCEPLRKEYVQNIQRYKQDNEMMSFSDLILGELKHHESK